MRQLAAWPGDTSETVGRGLVIIIGAMVAAVVGIDGIGAIKYADYGPWIVGLLFGLAALATFRLPVGSAGLSIFIIWAATIRHLLGQADVVSPAASLLFPPLFLFLFFYLEKDLVGWTWLAFGGGFYVIVSAWNEADGNYSYVAVGVLIFFLGLAIVVAKVLNGYQLSIIDIEKSKVAELKEQRRIIARELHDTVTNNNALIVMRAEMSKLRGIPDPGLAADLDYILTTARQTTVDMRAMLRVLRSDSPRTPLVLVQQDVAEVISARVRLLENHSFKVKYVQIGTLENLPTSVVQVLSKTITEGTSNIIKHGKVAGECSIAVERSDDSVSVALVNEFVSTKSTSAGLGLIGVRERVEYLNGQYASSAIGGKWLLSISIPVGR